MQNTDTEEGQPALAVRTTINPFDREADPDVGDEVENQFSVPKGIRATLEGQVVDSTTEEDLSAFDPANFIATGAAIVASMPARKVDYISLRKPAASEYIRVTADKNYRMSPVYLLEVKKGIKNVQYLINGDCIGDVLSVVGNKVVKSYSIVLAITNSGDPFLWYVRAGAEDDWSESAVALQKQAIDDWLRIESAGTHYRGIRPKDKLNEPKWPKESFPQLLKLAFGSRIVKSVDHPAVKAILGINS
jgi:hypothetical protein